MHKTRTLILLCCALAFAGCQQQSPPPQAIEPAAPPPTPAPVEPADVPAPKRVAGALKSALPEGFVLPFSFHRLYDNTGKTEAGTPQRRILVEYLDLEAPAIQAALSDALQAKGFAVPSGSSTDVATELRFTRADGASVVVKVTPGREKPRVPGAKGIVHLVWNAG